MILTAHQPVYLPWLGLFHKIALSDSFVWFDQVQYQNKDWNNRNKILTNAGPIWLSVPVLNKGHYEIKLADIKINNTLPWKRKHFKSIKFAYEKSQYFNYYKDFFEDLYSKNWDLLSDLNLYILKFLLKELNINVPILKLSELKVEGRKSDLVLSMCKKLHANLYIFGEEGKNYADEKKFIESGVKPYFQKYNHPIYSQLHDGFATNLSIIDLLFNNGPESFNIMMSGNVNRTDGPQSL